MIWFGVKLLVHAVDQLGQARISEESIRVVRAQNPEAVAAMEFKPTSQGIWVGEDFCRWTVARILDVCDIGPHLQSGTEVYTVLLHPHEAKWVSEFYPEG